MILTDQLAAALRRTLLYLDLLPPTAAEQIKKALEAYELEKARAAIIQRPEERQE